MNAKLLTKNSYCLQSTKNSRNCRNGLSEKREIRGAQDLEISAINVSGDLSYAGWLCVLEERPFDKFIT
jgi:hypothetical protein